MKRKLNGEILNCFSSDQKRATDVCTHHFYCARGPSAIKQGKCISKVGKEKIKFLSLEDNMMVHMDNTKESTKRKEQAELINDFS